MGYGTTIKDVYLSRILPENFDRKLRENNELIIIYEDYIKALGLYSQATIMNDEGVMVSTVDFIPSKIRELLDGLKDFYIENHLIELAKISKIKTD